MFSQFLFLFQEYCPSETPDFKMSTSWLVCQGRTHVNMIWWWLWHRKCGILLRYVTHSVCRWPEQEVKKVNMFNGKERNRNDIQILVKDIWRRKIIVYSNTMLLYIHCEYYSKDQQCECCIIIWCLLQDERGQVPISVTPVL